MRLIKLADFKYKQMTLARPVFDSKRRVLLAAGKDIHPKYLTKLQEMGIHYVYVDDKVSKGISLDDLVDMPTWTDGIQALNEFTNQVKEHNPKKDYLNVYSVQKTVTELLKELHNRPFLVTIPATAVAKELQSYAHAVNVTLMALMTAKKLRYNGHDLKDLALGCLLHDIGKVYANDEDHPVKGFEVLRKIREVNLVSAHVAYQHHETLDGEGYPRQLAGKEIHDMAQICAIANLYEHLISRDHHSPDEAMEIIMTKADQQYKLSIVQAFYQTIPAFPPGTQVMIANKERGIVTRIESHLQRPVVRILSKGKELSLADHPSVMIKAVSE